VLSYRIGRGDTPLLRAVALPPGLDVEVYLSGQSASTPELIGRVNALEARDPSLHAGLLAAQAEAAEDAESAVLAGDVAAFVRALSAQYRALEELGARAGAPIVTEPCRALAELAEREGGAALPAGAGGGDVLIFAGVRPSSSEFRALAQRFQHERLALVLGARGVHACAVPERE
jgi:phosphomevalonate kinase